MAKKTVEFTRAEVTAGGGYLFETVAGQQYPFANRQELDEYLAEVETIENALRLGIGKLVQQEPNLIPNAQGKFIFLIGKAVDFEVVSATQVVIR